MTLNDGFFPKKNPRCMLNESLEKSLKLKNTDWKCPASIEIKLNLST